MSNSCQSNWFQVGSIVLRINMTLGRDRHNRRRKYSTWGSWRRGRWSVISLTFCILCWIQFFVNCRSPMGVPSRTMPESLIRGMPLSRGSSVVAVLLGDQTVDLGMMGGWTVLAVERNRPLTGPSLRMRLGSFQY